LVRLPPNRVKRPDRTLKLYIYLKQPAGFEDLEHPDWVWKLEKAIYGLKQAGYEWNQTLDEHL
jgi:hypothetical protein